MKKLKDKYLGKPVVIREAKLYSEPYAGERGKVVAKVKEGRGTDYIVQFKRCWAFFRAKQMRVEK